MKLFKVVILSIILLSNSIRVSLVYGWYTLDVESFIDQLCENKDKPQLECNGKCYLSKMIASDSSQDEQKIPVLEWEQLVFFQPEIREDNQMAIAASAGISFHYLATYTKGYFHSIFHPPQA